MKVRPLGIMIQVTIVPLLIDERGAAPAAVCP